MTDKNKPVAWRIFRKIRWDYRDEPTTAPSERANWQPLYAHRAEWVGLTVKEVTDLAKPYINKGGIMEWELYAIDINTKLKEKNA